MHSIIRAAMKSLHSDEGGSLECTSRACNIRLKRRGVHIFGLEQAVLVAVIWQCLGYNKLRHAGGGECIYGIMRGGRGLGVDNEDIQRCL